MAGRTSQVLIKYTVVKVHSNCVSLIQDKVQNVYRIFRPWYHQWKEKVADLIFLGQQTILNMQKNSAATPERNYCQQNCGIPQPPSGGENMPRKSVDIRLTDYPVKQKRGQLRPFPAFRRGQVRAEPEYEARGWSLVGFGATPQGLKLPISAIFKVRVSPFFSPLFFIDYLTLPEDIVYIGKQVYVC